MLLKEKLILYRPGETEVQSLVQSFQDWGIQQAQAKKQKGNPFCTI